MNLHIFPSTKKKVLSQRRNDNINMDNTVARSMNARN